ncbi:MAG TPA: xanthine dehydrogenase family protein molybdopterin-binding subunit [Xanthobacteraceae bacterium]|nr:xanthine dehydrogenase family protein molybdopterin-binding subunit [Xanthobacteraceae bacterium]
MTVHAMPSSDHAPRIEDEALVRGEGRFLDDVRRPNQTFAVFVRSPHAAARIRGIDTAEAERAPGVIAVLTGADIKAAGVGSISRHPPMVGRGGAKLVMPPRPALADERVAHVGQAVALVIAASSAQAQDAAERVAVDYEPLPSVTDVQAAVEPGAPQIWDEAPGNVALDWPGPVADDGTNAHQVTLAITTAAHVARVSLLNQRLAVASMEPRGATAEYDAASGNYTLRVCSQSAAVIREQLISIMGWPRERLRVVSEDVGGAFGMKTPVYPEYPALLVAARHTGRPVHWMSTRTEAFLSDNQARDGILEAELALDHKGKFLAMRVRELASLGAFVTPAGAHLATNNFARCFPGMYRIPRVDVSVRCVFTNTVPTGPYRGAGRPEANYLLERLVDEAARVSGIDRVSLRRRNLIPKSAMPYRTPVGTTYDSGDFPAVFEKALALSAYNGFAKRQREARKRGTYRGIGICCFVEHAGGMPTEGASMWFPGGDTLAVGIGVQATGQAHATVFGRLVAARLGIPARQVQVRQGDTRLEVASAASVASRSTMAVGTALVRAGEAMLEKGRKVAAQLLEAADADIIYRDGAFVVAGTDRRVSLFEVAARAEELAARGEIAESLDTKLTADTPQTFPNGCHIAEVEIDPATGIVTVVTYTAVDDCGNVLDHTIVEGQVQGGVAQGLGQVLFENLVYDRDSGQLVSGSFMDYAMPRATDMPRIVGSEHVVPATTNPLGVKGVGEAGTVGSLAAIMNAIADAIPNDGGRRLDMPATPERVWAACRSA